MLAGIAYCQVIALCQAVFDLRRAREWTDALDSARRACEWLAGPPAWDALGSAYYQLAEIQRLQGELADAEESYRSASLAGRDPEPGMSLLRLAQGRGDLAARAIRRALDETEDPLARSRLLPTSVEVLLEVDDVKGARTAADELAEIAVQLDVPYLTALAAHAFGAVLLAEGDPRAALTKLRTAQRSWRELEAPYDAARGALEQLGARPDLDRLARLAGSPRPGGLSRRESEVLTLVAAGKTNRAIAAELVISEKTVARHVSNIFAKLKLSSRAEATAYAYKHGLAR